MIKISLLLRPPAAAAAIDEAVDDGVDEAVVDWGEDVAEVDSCATAVLKAPTAEAAPLMKALRGFTDVVAACPDIPATYTSAITAERREWYRILGSL